MNDKRLRKRSAMMELAFARTDNDKNMKLSTCIALYLTLGLLWLPGFTSTRLIEVEKTELDKKVRVRLKPPPEKPLEKVITIDRRATKVPMPDRTPDEPEPIVEKTPDYEMEFVETDEWVIGIPVTPATPSSTIFTPDSLGVESPIFIKRVPPEYPLPGRRVKMQGHVMLSAILRKDGTIDDIKVVKALGKGRFGFESAAEEALNQWKFLPGKLNDKMVDVRMNLRVDFVMN